MVSKKSEISQSLSDHEIVESLDARQEVMDILSRIYLLEYQSQIREFWPKLPRIAAELNLSEEEVDVISAALRNKKLLLTTESVGGVAVEEWTPSGVLKNLPPNNARDPLEKAANDRKDKE